MRENLRTMDKKALGKFSGKSLAVFGAGYVGGEIVRAGLARGMRVAALTRNADKARELEAAGARVVVAELASDAWWREIGGADFVVSCVSAGGRGLEGYRRSYVDGMQSVTAWLRERGGAEGFVYTSSTSVYPQSGGVVTEEMRNGDERDSAKMASPEAMARRADSDRAPFGRAESQCGVRHAAAPVDERTGALVEAERLALAGGACVLRLAGIYGPGRHALLDQLRAGARVLPGHGAGRLNLIHRDDAAAAVWAVLECGGAGGEIFNVCDDGAASRGEVVRWLAEKTGAAAPVFSGEGARGTLDRAISNAKIKTRTGWRPRFATFREGYEAMLDARA